MSIRKIMIIAYIALIFLVTLGCYIMDSFILPMPFKYVSFVYFLAVIAATIGMIIAYIITRIKK